MRAYEVKGLRIGEGRPKAIVPLMDATVDELLTSAAAAVREGAECLEWRADFYAQPLDAHALAEACHALQSAFPATPLLFTMRTAGQGGRLELETDQYASLVREVVAEGAPDLTDIEVGIGDGVVRQLVEHAHAHGLRAIVSHHDFAATPDISWMESCLVHMAELGADIPKIAVMAHSSEDCLRLMEATAAATRKTGLPLLTMAMGPHGALSRLAGETCGSALTFCALGRASAPGQVELGRAIAAMDALHAALGAGEE